ncbi:MAG: dUTP diphosphatase [Pseudomonas sp.]|nr:dUTP diphosphatase [Pseudomonas sp.]
MLKVKLLHEDAKLPVRAHDSDAGLDLFSIEDAAVKARGRLLVKTGISIQLPFGHIELPFGYYGQVASKSGLSVKHGIEVGAGVIDEGYTGEVMVMLYNHSDDDFEINKGDKIAQLLVKPVSYCDVQQVNYVSDSYRGNGGFGSTGR